MSSSDSKGPGVSGLAAKGVKPSELHPTWYPPTQQDGVGLKVLNSLTDTLVPFAPKNGRVVKWYTCGPTVYDVSHMGHARAYLTFDILRRVMEDYFGYQVHYHMNITDIDDKIIKKARVNKLLDDYKGEIKGDVKVLEQKILAAIELAKANLAARKVELDAPLDAKVSKRVKVDRETKQEELKLKHNQFIETDEKISIAIKAKSGFDAIFDAASGVVGELLDKEKGGSIIDQGIFEAHARKFEETFFDDCDRLGIRPPDVLSRVTEVVPDVVNYIQKIVDNGFAYKGESSVFFDTQAFTKAGHSYPKLKPTGEAENTTADEMAEGEGSLSAAVAGEKKHANDFALWKFSKPGEPRWPSPWGEGRPGWHIECSVMASGVLGENMDIHAGGCDLRFPHHDNELAQSEAYWGHQQWVNYFLHCGHLSIKGLKMSKSLKNFITIRQALDGGISPREMRILFLSSPWAGGMNFSDQSVGEARERGRVLRAFFGSLDIEFRKDFLKLPQGFTALDKSLNQDWATTESAIHAALQNNFDTQTAFNQVMNLVASTNAYLLKTEQRPNLTILRKVGRYITRMLKVFGIVQGGDDIGLNDNAKSEDDRLVPVVDSLVKFRDDVRKTAIEKKLVADFLPICDQLRDEYLPPAGIRLEDKPGGAPTQWKFDDPAVLLKEIADKKIADAAAKRNKIANALNKEKLVINKWTAFLVSPEKLFVEGPDAGKYSAVDEATGVPTKEKSGAEISDKAQVKLQTAITKHAKGCDEFKKKGGAELLEATNKKIADLEAELKAFDAVEEKAPETAGGDKKE